MMRSTATLLAVALLVILSGCKLRQDYPESRRYSLQVRRPGPPREPAAGMRLTVANFEVSRRFEGEQMVYRLADGSWETDYYSRFLVAPGSILNEETNRWFMTANVAESLIAPTSFVAATHGIEGTVVGLYGDYSDPEQAHAVLELQLYGLDRDDAGDPRIFLSREYEKRIPVADRTSRALVTGWEQALREILTAFEEDFVRTLAGETP